MEKELKWGTIIPLIGGSAIGCKKSAGNEPAFHLSYDAFAANESHIEKYSVIKELIKFCLIKYCKYIIT
jgi:hypothetical protein